MYTAARESMWTFIQMEKPRKWCTCVSPEPSVLGGSSSRYDFGDEDTGIFTDVGVVCAARDAEAQPRVSLDIKQVMTVLKEQWGMFHTGQMCGA